MCLTHCTRSVSKSFQIFPKDLTHSSFFLLLLDFPDSSPHPPSFSPGRLFLQASWTSSAEPSKAFTQCSTQHNTSTCFLFISTIFAILILRFIYNHPQESDDKYEQLCSDSRTILSFQGGLCTCLLVYHYMLPLFFLLFLHCYIFFMPHNSKNAGKVENFCGEYLLHFLGVLHWIPGPITRWNAHMHQREWSCSWPWWQNACKQVCHVCKCIVSTHPHFSHWIFSSLFVPDLRFLIHMYTP